MVVAGRASPPGRSVSVPVTLSVDEGGMVHLRDVNDEIWRSAPVDDLRIDQPLARLDRKVTFPDGVLFQTPDHVGLDAALGRTRGHTLHGAEAFRPRLIAAIAATIVGIGLIWRFALPVLVAFAVWLTPDPMLRQMDAGTLLTLDRLLLNPSSLPAGRQAEIADMHAALLEQVDPRDVPSTTLLFRDAGKQVGPNAFALPGGTVVVTDELARLLQDDPDELAGVLAHEISHVTEDHGLKALYRSIALYVVVSLMAGDTGPILDEILLEGNVLLSLRGSRDAEREADARAIPILQGAGYNPEGLARFFDRLETMMGDGGGWASTHPGSGERAARIRNLAR
ncbi:M48 family metallopeptidase [Jannaschia donghaensis]|uniref:TPR repeat-containing protein YfgC n=1 Tax=Jannaschia donghaensis TaxID=420998 RepID=A0A0M6YHG8_9RHOB|nr:M48 family metallopeptidase [Jannaschia donghaensis]CTQ49400.1 TPR repeat-containing protein YfgC precursor [Jannaschia donghaensis]